MDNFTPEEKRETFDLLDLHGKFAIEKGVKVIYAVGIALSRPELKVVVFDGDGSILMNLGALTTLARYRPPNLLHVVFDN